MATFTGTGAPDNYYGGAQADQLEGLGGDDILVGNAGDDVIDGGADNDNLFGGEGNDELRGGAGDDVLNDILETDGFSLLDGGEGFDWLELRSYGYAGGITIDLEDSSGSIRNFERITLSGGNGVNTVRGGADLDIMSGGASDDYLEGRGGDDDLRGFGGNDVLIGGAGDDHLAGGDGADRVYGGDGDDAVNGGTEGSYVDGGTGNDSVRGYDGDDTLIGGEGNDYITGNGGVDVMEAGAGDDSLDGGAGADTMRGGAGNDTYFVDDAGDVVEENAGEGVDRIHSSLAVYSLVDRPAVENLSARSVSGVDFRGNSLNNLIFGSQGNDVIRLYDGGDDAIGAGGGNDTIFLGATLTAADAVSGGGGVDTLVLQGNYADGLILGTNVTQIENISILAGSNTNFGESGTGRFDYTLVVNDANFAAGVQARINGAALLEGEDFTFDGSAETDAKFVVYGGKGKDTLTGGLGNDIFFYAEERFASGDTVNGGAGYDGMFLRGNYTIDFNAPGYTGLFTNIENLTLTSATDERYARGGGIEFDYNLTLSDAIVKPGETLTVSGALLMASETMVLDGSAELDGLLRLFGGKAGDTLKGGSQADILHGGLGADTLAGNGGADTFRFDSVAESNSGSTDHILDFAAGADRIDLSRIDADSNAAGNQAFAWIGSDAFSGTAGQLRAYDQDGSWFVEGDTNGDTVADLVIQVTVTGGPPTQADFLP